VADGLGDADLVPFGMFNHDSDSRWPGIPVRPTIYIRDQIQDSTLSNPKCLRSFRASRELSGSCAPKMDRFPQFCEKPIRKHLQSILTCRIDAPFYGLHLSGSRGEKKISELHQNRALKTVETTTSDESESRRRSQSPDRIVRARRDTHRLHAKYLFHHGPQQFTHAPCLGDAAARMVRRVAIQDL